MSFTRKFLFMIVLFVVGLPAALASSCYSAIEYGEPVSTHAKRALYIIVDQTIPLSADMKNRVHALTQSWGNEGDKITVARFSANFRGKHPSILFSQWVEPPATAQYLYGLRMSDRQKLEACLQASRKSFREQVDAKLTEVLNGIDPKIPKTDILYSLKEISRHVVDDPVKEKIVLIVSDGLENSDVSSFYSRGKMRKINSRKEISKARRRGLVANWSGAKIYMYGLGLMSKSDTYMKSSTVKSLRDFWERYFVEGNANIVAIGSPELLISEIN